MVGKNWLSEIEKLGKGLKLDNEQDKIIEKKRTEWEKEVKEWTHSVVEGWQHKNKTMKVREVQEEFGKKYLKRLNSGK